MMMVKKFALAPSYLLILFLLSEIHYYNVYSYSHISFCCLKHYLNEYTLPTSIAFPMRTHLFSKISNVAEEEALKWFDEAIVFVRAGSGGAGATAFKFGKGRQHSIPNGGSGGNGGNVIFVVDNSLNTLLGFRAKNSFRAGNGDSGGLVCHWE